MENKISAIHHSVYSKIVALMPIVCVDVILFGPDKKKTILFKRKNKPMAGVYFTLGGRVLKNEALLNAAKRQAHKEAGITIKKDGLVFGGVQEENHRTSIFPGVSYHAVVIFYGYVLKGTEKISLDEQHSGYKWFDVHDSLLHPLVKQKIDTTLGKL